MQTESETVGPRGTVTFLFTDIEGSTRLLQQLGATYPTVLDDQRALCVHAFEQHGGHLVDTAGDGLFFVFQRARDALIGTIEAQVALATHSWPQSAIVRVRMGLHTGEPVASAAGYTGLDVHRAARIAAAAHGGQIVVSEATRQLVAVDLPDGVELFDLGDHWLKDLPHAERLYQVRAEGLMPAFPPLRGASRVLRANLPERGRQLIGRAEELSALRELLLRDDVKLLTVTGTGGTGKTSLAIEVASRCMHDFRDGIGYVGLAPIADASLVFTAIAHTIGLSPPGEQPILDALIEHLSERRLLLVLDNFEHVLSAATDVASLVASCPSITVLVTSRFALRLSMEREFPLAPLPAPDPATTRTAVALQAYPAVELFTQRATAVSPGFHLDDESAVAVAGICRRLDGLPLAIELAAARIKLFSPRALLARLDRRLELLGDGPRDLPARHRTLRQAIGWSYDLLEPAEQAVFRRLAVFSSGCSLESAEAVCTAAGEPVLSALEGVAALVDKSLLRREFDEDGEPRFVMLETVREFALEQLAASREDDATRAAHADLLIALAETALPHLAGPGQREWLPRLGREHDDMRSAFDWTIRTNDAARALRLGAAWCRFWIIRGFHREGRNRLRAALALPRSQNAAVRARALSGAAILAYEQGGLNEANTYLREVLEYYRDAGDERGLAETLNHLGWAVFFTGDVDRAETLTEDALALHEKNGDVRGMGLSLTNLGAVAAHRGQLHRARALYERALDLRRAQNDARSISYGALNLGSILVRLGELDAAAVLAKDAEQALRALGDKQILAYALYVLGWVTLERGDVQAALAPLEESVALGREVMQGASLGLALSILAESLAHAGDHERAIELAREAIALHERGTTHVWLVDSLRSCGTVLRLVGSTQEARTIFQRALHMAAPHNLRLHASDCLAGLAVIASDEGKYAVAIRLVSAARAMRADSGAPFSHRHPDLDRIETAAISAIGIDAVARARDEGAASDLQQIERLLD